MLPQVLSFLGALHENKSSLQGMQRTLPQTKLNTCARQHFETYPNPADMKLT